MNAMEEVIITKHAFDRAKERLSWGKDVLNKMANKAFTEGIKHSEAKGHLSKYISKLFLEYKKANNIRVYGHDIFLFKDNTLITLYHLPNDLLKYVKISKNKQIENERD